MKNNFGWEVKCQIIFDTLDDDNVRVVDCTVYVGAENIDDAIRISRDKLYKIGGEELIVTSAEMT